MGQQADSVHHHVLRRIVGKGKGWVFTPADFQDLGNRTAVGLAIMRRVAVTVTEGQPEFPHAVLFGIASVNRRYTFTA